jgi:antitoxin HicB
LWIILEYNPIMDKKVLHNKLNFTVICQPAKEGGYTVHVPALPGCHTQGETMEEAEKNAKEAIECHLLAMKKMGEAVPEEQVGAKIFTIELNLED